MRRLVAAVVAVLALPLLAQAPQPQQGAALFEQGRLEDAKRLLAPLKNDPDALIVLGKVAMAQNDTEAAEGYLVKAVEKKPNSAEAHFWLGNVYGSQAQKANLFKKASLASKTRAEFETAVKLDPNFIDARLGLVDYYILAPGFMGGSEEKAMQQAAEIKKRDALQGHRAYARIYTRQKKTDLARTELINAVREQPQSPKAHNYLASFYVNADKNFPAALAEAENALKVDPNYMPAHFRIGQIAALSGTNFNRGEEELKKYLAYTPGTNEPDLASTYYFLGMVYEKQGKKAEAKQSYAAALKMNPQSKAFNEAMKRVS